MNVFIGMDSAVVELDATMLNVIIGAVGTVIDQCSDDPDARAYTDALHDVEHMLVKVRARLRVHHMKGIA